MGLYIILMGVQGAGKGLQAGYIAETYGIPHVSTGELFRAMKTREDDLARHVQQIMAEGRLIDDDTTNAVVADRLAQPDAADGVILDGYPRNANQARYLKKVLAARSEAITAVLLLELDLYVAFKRAFGRVTAPDGTSYNIYTNRQGLDVTFREDPTGTYPPAIEVTLQATGEKLIRRPDDANAAAIIKRIDTYLESTSPLIDYYENEGLVRWIDADQPVPDVSAAIRVVIDEVRDLRTTDRIDKGIQGSDG
jgi:adenylate kinase